MPLATIAMRSLADPPPATEPVHWLLVFHVKTSQPALDRLIPGRFKHVSAIGFVDGVWIFYDVGIGGRPLQIVRGARGEAMADAWIAGNSVLRMRSPEVRPALPRLGLWCVPAIKHLVGSRSGALLCSTLWRDLIASGAEVIIDVFAAESRPERANA